MNLSKLYNGQHYMYESFKEMGLNYFKAESILLF